MNMPSAVPVAAGGPLPRRLVGYGTEALPDSTARFPDGVAFRVEIPSVEGELCLETALSEAERLDVPVRRISQGSGVMLQTDAELDRMAAIAAAAGIEVSLFARPNASWGVSATTKASAGATFAPAARGPEQLRAVVDDIVRAAEHGFRSVLVADVGVLSVFKELRDAGDLPSDMQAKVSVMLPVSNPATAEVVVGLGADTINLPTDLSLAQIASIRAVVDVPLDIYIESPDNIGGFLRYEELAELVRVAAPVYLKFGLRNAPDVYPSGTHLESVAAGLTTERVRRARLGMERLVRDGVAIETSEPRAAGLAVPVVDGDG